MKTSKQSGAKNQANALKSKGPQSDAGKAVSCQNARRHGVFSERLILEDEDLADFESLQLDLQSSLAPVGTIELTLVERIAITMWRQRRLVSAESASLALQRQARALARDASSFRGAGLGRDVDEDELQPFDEERADWCQAAVTEIEELDEITVTTLRSHAPYVWQQLRDDAKDDHETPEALLETHDDGATGYVMELYSWCKQELKKAAERPKLLALADQLKQKRLVLPLDQMQLFARYQTTLDNQLYKALQALRDAQEWRMKSLETVAHPSSSVQNKAA